MFAATQQLSDPWWRRLAAEPGSSHFVQSLLSSLLVLSGFDHLYLWAFEVDPEIYFDPSLSHAHRFILELLAFPALQALLGLLALLAVYILNTPSSYRRLLVAWALASLLWTCHALVYSVERFRIAPMFFLALLFILLFTYWQMTMDTIRIGPLYGPQMRPMSRARRFRLLSYAAIGAIALSWYTFELRRPSNLNEAAPFIGQRMINRRGAWMVERFTYDGQSKPYPAQRVFFHRNGYCRASKPDDYTYGEFKAEATSLSIDCLPLVPDKLSYAFEGDKLHLSAPGFALTLRQDNWGPGYYDDIFPFLGRMR